MKQLRLLSPVLLFALSTLVHSGLFAQSALAYTTPESNVSWYKKKKKSGGNLKEHLWYGGGLALGFYGGSGYSEFDFGLSPMVGYKIIGPLSAGPRVSILYSSLKFPGIKAYNLFDVELSLFARVRVFKGFFVQGEIGTVSDQYVYQDPFSGELGKGKRSRPAQYVGLGYNFSNGEGGMGQEIAIMYDFYVANDINAYEQPWQYRIAFTYGF